MAETKIMTLAAQQYYDEKIKAFIADEDEKLVNGQIKTNTDAIAAINNENTGILKQAKDYADGKDEAIQAAKKAGDDAAAAASVADGKAVAAQNDVDALEIYVGTIPSTATATDVIGYIQEKTSGIATDTALEELTGRVAQTETDIDNIEKDYLKAADKTELQGNIDVVSGKVATLVGEDANKSVRTIANEELAKQLVAEGAKESLDTLAEIAAWIQSHPDDASAMNKAIDDLEALVGAMPDGVAATTIIAYIQEVVAAEKSRAEGVEAGLEGRLATVEGAVATVDSRIATAKSEAAADATSKANKALEDAKIDASNKDAVVLAEAQKASAAVQTALDTHTDNGDIHVTAEQKTQWSEAYTKRHEHSNMSVLEGVTAAKITEWNKVTAKADATALQAEIKRATAAEEANAAAIASFVEITNQEIDNMFA